MPTQDSIGTDFESCELPGIFSEMSICENQHLLDSVTEPSPPLPEEKRIRHRENTVLHEESRGESLILCAWVGYIIFTSLEMW